MRKPLVIFIFILAFVASAAAQEIAIRTSKLYNSYTTATSVTGTTVNNMDVFCSVDYLYYYDIQWSADSVDDETNFSLQLQGSNDNSNFYNIGSAVTWYVAADDTIVRWTNHPSSETWSIAQHTRTTAAFDMTKPAKTDYINGTFDTTTVSAVGGNANYIKDDTITVAVDTFEYPAQVQTIAAQAYTITKQYKVGWRYLRVAATGAGSGAECSITAFTASIRKD